VASAAARLGFRDLLGALVGAHIDLTRDEAVLRLDDAGPPGSARGSRPNASAASGRGTRLAASSLPEGDDRMALVPCDRNDNANAVLSPSHPREGRGNVAKRWDV